MLFGVRLANEIYPPWKDAYIQYEHLKKLLKENVVPSSSESWTEADETSFVSVLDSELEKVYSFQTKTYDSLSDRLSTLEKSINDNNNLTPDQGKNLESDLEEILEEAQQLDRFSRINFTGFLKIVKKHDRVHPKYQVKPLLQVRLSALPFHSEDYSPLLYRISVIYSFLSENFGSGQGDSASASAAKLSVNNSENSDYTTYKFWVHPDNVMEVKTRILRHLPLLVYGSKADAGNGSAEASQHDPTITSLYFDNSKFELYESKLQKNDVSPSLRLRWSGKLSDKPEITLEKKVINHNITGEYIPDERIDIKEKYIQGFLSGKYHMEKTVQKMKDRGTPSTDIESYEKSVDNLQEFIAEHELQPVVRTVYTRSAFQIPGDNRVRAILDSDIVFIREDAFDQDRPIRDPDSWHRSDIDAPGLENPLSVLRKGEFSKFPFAVLEFRILNRGAVSAATGTSTSLLSSSGLKGPTDIPAIKRHGKWISELTNSHLVKEVPKFSKFVQGIASLFAEDDRLDYLPFWLHLLEHDIRQDPKQAWEEQRKRVQEARQASQESNKIRARTSRLSLSADGSSGSPSSGTLAGPSNGKSGSAALSGGPIENIPEEAVEEENDEEGEDDLDDDDSDSEEEDDSSAALLKKKKKSKRGLKLLQNLSLFHKSGPRLDGDSEDEEVYLPPGVVKPDVLIRQSGPVKVETKVWLANERTFNRWLHVTTLFSALTFTLYSTVGRASDKTSATIVAYILFGLTIFSAVWGYWTYLDRLKHIRARSELHLDNPVGPLIVAVGLLAALVINFVSVYNDKVWNPKHPHVDPIVNATIV